MRLILASSSPRRSALLRSAGFKFDVFPVNVDERVRPGEAASAYVARLAEEKARAAAESLDARGLSSAAKSRGQTPISKMVVLGADTIVTCGGEVLGKPADRADAERMLRLLSGRTHDVLTGICLLDRNQRLIHVESSRVRMSELTDSDIAWYLASGEPMDKAGGYAVQGLASRFIEAVEGSYANVVGLPVAAVSTLLKQLGYDILGV